MFLQVILANQSTEVTQTNKSISRTSNVIYCFDTSGAAECVPGMIKQTLDLLLECVSQPVEGIARLGCSCLR